jgi:hypothetical protein
MGLESVSVAWTAIGAGVVALVVARVWWRYHAPQPDALGTVSEQWVAEHRLNRPDSQR